MKYTVTRERGCFTGYVVGTLLLVSGFLWAGGIISSSIPMYIGLVVIAISLFSRR